MFQQLKNTKLWPNPDHIIVNLLILELNRCLVLLPGKRFECVNMPLIFM